MGEYVSEHENISESEEAGDLKSGLIKGIIPMVLIVVQGGPGTLQTVEEAVKQNVPVLVLAVKKGFFLLVSI